MRNLRLAILAITFWVIGSSTSLRAEVNPNGELGDVPLAPTDVSGRPGRGAHPDLVTSGFSVNTSSREQVREFYNSIGGVKRDGRRNTRHRAKPIDVGAATATTPLFSTPDLRTRCAPSAIRSRTSQTTFADT